MEKLQAFVKASWEEVTQHVTWPTASGLRGSSTLVLVASLIFALMVGLVDLAFKNALSFIYNL
jgi:preprotein translocase subunit SecE